MAGNRVIVFCLLVCSWWLPVAGQELLISQPLHMAGDTLEGVAFMGDEELKGYAYFLTLFGQEGDIVENELVWVEKQQFPFRLPLGEDLPSGYYLLQLTNYQNLAVTHAETVVLLDKEGSYEGLTIGESETVEAPRRHFLELEVVERPTLVETKVLPMVDASEIASISVTAYDLGQNPARVSKPCEGAADHRVASRGLNQWLTTFHVEGWLMQGEEPIVGETITMSDPDDVLELRYTTTNETGKFSFYNVDFDGMKDIYLTVQNRELADYKLLIGDSRSSALAPACPVNAFPVRADQLEQWVSRRLLYRKVIEQYFPRTSPRRELSLPDPQPLYEDADNTVLLDDYVSFNTVEEVIKEVVPYVHLMKGRLRVFSPERRRSFEGDPLLLLNGIAVPQDSLIFGLDVDELHSVQVLNKVGTTTPMGRVASNGVVSFVTRDPAFRPKGLVPHRLAGFAVVPPAASPKWEQDAPFFPTVLHWDPDLRPQNGIWTVTMRKPAYNTTIRVVAKAQLKNGEVITGEQMVATEQRPR